MGDLFDSLSSETGLTLQEGTEKLGDKEVYVLTAEASGSEIDSLMGEMDSLTEGVGDVDLSDIKANVTLRVYKDEMLPASVTVEVPEGVKVSESDGTSLEINSMSIVMDYTEFDTIESIQIPEEALNSRADVPAETTGETDTTLEAVVNEDDLAGLQGLYAKAPGI